MYFETGIIKATAMEFHFWNEMEACNNLQGYNFEAKCQAYIVGCYYPVHIKTLDLEYTTTIPLSEKFQSLHSCFCEGKQKLVLIILPSNKSNSYMLWRMCDVAQHGDQTLPFS